MAQIELTDVRKSFDSLEVIHGVNLSVPDGCFVVVVGPSGCGKSTLLRMVAGLEDVSAGSIAIGGRDVTALEPKDRNVAMVFQNYALYPHKTVASNMAFALRMRGMNRAEIDQRVKKAAEILGLTPYLDRYPRALSGGQRQRIAIARALASGPKIIVCDEPTSALDVSVQSQVLNLMSDLREELGLTYLFISHDLTVVQHMADKIGVLYLGTLVEEAPRDALFSDPKHPYTQMIFDAAPRMDAFGREVEPPKGEIPDAINPPTGCPYHPRCPIAVDRCSQEKPVLRHIGDTRVACHLAE